MREGEQTEGEKGHFFGVSLDAPCSLPGSGPAHPQPFIL